MTTHNKIWQSASGIDDHVDELRRLVDRAELDPSPELFHQIRLRLSDIGNEAGFIMIQTKDQKVTVLDCIDPRKQAAVSSSRQRSEA